MRPRARPDVLLQELGDEGLLYDFATHRAHCLDRGALAVWRRCDGTRSIAELTKLVSAELGTPVTRDWIHAALVQLGSSGLLEAELAPKLGHRATRRRVMAGAALALPAVWSILSPSVAEAASRMCVPPPSCMGSGPTTCCGNSGSTAMTCAGGTCSGSGALLCNYVCK
jgi:hypothetical protein